MKDLSIDLDARKTAELVNNLRRKEIEGIRAGQEGVKLMTELTFDIAQSRVPVDSGALKASGYTAEKNTSDEIKGVIGYGTSTTNRKGERSADYAVKRHEMPYRKDSPETHKWLENTLLDVGSSQFLDEVKRLIIKALESK